MGCVYTFKLGQNEHEEHMVRVKMNGQSRGVWNLSTRKEIEKIDPMRSVRLFASVSHVFERLCDQCTILWENAIFA